MKLHSRNDWPTIAIVLFGFAVLFSVAALSGPKLIGRGLKIELNGRRLNPADPADAERIFYWQIGMAAAAFFCGAGGAVAWKKWRSPRLRRSEDSRGQLL